MNWLLNTGIFYVFAEFYRTQQNVQNLEVDCIPNGLHSTIIKPFLKGQLGILELQLMRPSPRALANSGLPCF